MSSSARVLPRDTAAEESVIGGVLFHGRALLEVADLLRPEDFYDPRHEAIWAAMLALHAATPPVLVDLVTVAAQLRLMGTMPLLNASGGEAYLVELVNKAGSAAGLVAHARLVSAAATKRRLVLVGQALIEQGSDPEIDAHAHLEAAQRAIFEASSRSQRKPYRAAGDVLREAVTRLEQRATLRQEVTGVPTGFYELDRMTAGLHGGHLVVIAARPGMGKTAFALGCVEHAAVQHRIPALLFSLEMNDHELIERSLSSQGSVDGTHIRTGRLDRRDWAGIASAARRLGSAPLWVDDTASLTLMDIRTKVRRWRSDPAIFPPGAPLRGLVVVDYLQLIAPSEARGRSTNREQEISEISRGLKQLAKEIGLPVVALSQLNRAVEARVDKRPLPSDLRESGAIEQDADVIVLLYRDEVYDPETPEPGVAEVIVGKQRGGPIGTVKLLYRKQFTRFDNLSPRDVADHVVPSVAS